MFIKCTMLVRPKSSDTHARLDPAQTYRATYTKMGVLPSRLVLDVPGYMPTELPMSEVIEVTA